MVVRWPISETAIKKLTNAVIKCYINWSLPSSSIYTWDSGLSGERIQSVDLITFKTTVKKVPENKKLLLPWWQHYMHLHSTKIISSLDRFCFFTLTWCSSREDLLVFKGKCDPLTLTFRWPWPSFLNLDLFMSKKTYISKKIKHWNPCICFISPLTSGSHYESILHVLWIHTY